VASQLTVLDFKGSSDPSHFIFEIDAGKSRIRHITTLNLNLQSMLSRSENSSFNFRVVVCWIRLFPTLISKIKWLRSRLPFKSKHQKCWGRTPLYNCDKLGCVVRMVVDSILPHAEIGPNDHRKDAPSFIFKPLAKNITTTEIVLLDFRIKLELK